jgi:hypothetical protein
MEARWFQVYAYSYSQLQAVKVTSNRLLRLRHLWMYCHEPGNYEFVVHGSRYESTTSFILLRCGVTCFSIQMKRAEMVTKKGGTYDGFHVLQ